jgi:hypothetical protein
MKNNYGNIDWKKMKQFAGADKVESKIFKERNIKKDNENEASHHHNSDSESYLDSDIDNREYSEDELYYEAKHRYLMTLKGVYWDAFENGQ